MKITVPSNFLGNSKVTFSRLGYHQAPNGSFERRIAGGMFPRFHVYLKEKGERTVIDLHLDMSAHTLIGVKTHKGEYSGDVVATEAARIEKSFQK